MVLQHVLKNIPSQYSHLFTHIRYPRAENYICVQSGCVLPLMEIAQVLMFRSLEFSSWIANYCLSSHNSQPTTLCISMYRFRISSVFSWNCPCPRVAEMKHEQFRLMNLVEQNTMELGKLSQYLKFELYDHPLMSDIHNPDWFIGALAMM